MLQKKSKPMEIILSFLTTHNIMHCIFRYTVVTCLKRNRDEEDEIISFCVPVFMPNDRTLTIQPMVLLHYTAVAAADYANAMPKLS
jgi:hypothetical protein